MKVHYSADPQKMPFPGYDYNLNILCVQELFLKEIVAFNFIESQNVKSI